MAYKNPESKREGCYYPNCSGYLEVPFCCHDPKALPALKARLAQLETPKREWVGLTDEEIHEIIDACTPDEANLDEINDFAKAVFAAQTKLKEKNSAV